MKLGMIIEEYEDLDQICRSLEVESFIPWFAKNNTETYIINVLDDPFNGDFIKARDTKNNSKVILEPEDLEVIYYGITGQKIYLPNGNLNSLDENLEKITNSIEFFSKYPHIQISNSREAMVFGLSKDYLLKLKKNGISIVDTVEIKSKKELYDLTLFEKDLILKPKIAERGNGSVVVKDLDSEDKINNYSKKFLDYKKFENNDLYSQIRNRQGLIAQEFNSDFITTGEKKIYYVDGNITVSRRNEPNGICKMGDLNFRKNLVEKKYYPTKAEKNFVYELAEFLNSQGLKYDYFRADIIGNGSKETIKLNELELINPCSSAGHNPDNKLCFNPTYSQTEVDYHNNSLLNAFRKKCYNEVLK